MTALFPVPDQGPPPELDAASRVALGDELLKRFPSPKGRQTPAFRRHIASRGLSGQFARDCMVLAEWLSPSMRECVFGNVGISYSVLREAARDYSTSGMPDHQRWDTLRTMIEKAAREGRTKITAAEYRKAIGSRPIPNQASSMPPELIANQLDRPDVVAAIVDRIAADRALRHIVLMRLSESDWPA